MVRGHRACCPGLRSGAAAPQGRGLRFEKPDYEGCSIDSSNIAEGAARRSEKEFTRYLEIALGSAFEVETQLAICSRLGFIDGDEIALFLKGLSVEEKRINALITSLG